MLNVYTIIFGYEILNIYIHDLFVIIILCNYLKILHINTVVIGRVDEHDWMIIIFD